MECIITYQKSNGEIFIRPYDYTLKKKGEESSMGWKVLDIHYKYDGNYYCYEDFIRIFKCGFENEIKTPKKTRKKKILKYLINSLNEIDKNVN